MSKEDVKEILCQQLILLAEKSKDACIDDLIRISGAIDHIADTIIRISYAD